jgi:hypothetical protein
MKCKRCDGRVFIDRIFSDKKHLELYCIICGKRWMLSKEKSKVAQWLMRLEQAHENAVVSAR